MENNNNKKTSKKNNILDLVIGAVILVGLVICYFFWGCEIDPWVTLLTAVLVVAGSITLVAQTKKINKILDKQDA